MSCDLSDLKNKHYLVCMGYYSEYFEIVRIYEKKGKEVFSRLKAQLARH